MDENSFDISVYEVADLLKQNPPPRLLDVREDFEREICQIPGSLHLTEELVEEMLAHWERDTPLIFHCHHGGRSLSACHYFAQQGFTRLYNMAGGIDVWSQQIDPDLPRY